MPSRLRPLADPPILLARRGASAHAPEHSSEAYELAARLGATGVSGDAWLSIDGVVVLSTDGAVGGRLRRRRIAQLEAGAVVGDRTAAVTLDDAMAHGGAVVLDVRDPAVVQPALESARRAGVIDRLWLRHGDLDVLVEWRATSDAVHLVHTSRLTSLPRGPERHAAELRSRGIDALQLSPSDWTGGLTTLLHRFGRLAWGGTAVHERVVVELLDAGIDAVESAHVDRMVDGARKVIGVTDTAEGVVPPAVGGDAESR
jgi:hypothetical protein